MPNMMKYKGYLACIHREDKEGILIGRVAGIRDGVGFHANNVRVLRKPSAKPWTTSRLTKRRVCSWKSSLALRGFG